MELSELPLPKSSGKAEIVDTVHKMLAMMGYEPEHLHIKRSTAMSLQAAIDSQIKKRMIEPGVKVENLTIRGIPLEVVDG